MGQNMDSRMTATLWQEYLLPTTIHDALALLDRYGDQAEIVAGGTDLILEIQQGNQPSPRVLVDVTRIGGLNEIREEGDWILIGAAVTHAQIEESPLLRKHATALTESCGVVGGPQVRNVATLGGNVAHALPAADGTIGLLALDAEVQVCAWSAGGEQSAWQPLLSIFAGPGKNNLQHNQMIAGFRVAKRQPGVGSAFDRIMRPQGVALPVLGLAARLRVDTVTGRLQEAAIAIGPAGPIPFRATKAEEALCAATAFDAAAIEAAIGEAQREAHFRTSRHRATQEYREELLPVLLRRVLTRAHDAAMQP